MKRLALAALALALVLSSVACAAPSAGEGDTEAQDDGAIAQTQQAQTSNGFICNENGCICDDDTGSPIDSCTGMERVCRALGKGSLCSPSGGCYCRFDAAATTGALPTAPKKPVVRAATTTASATRAP